jgi:hypothetical protein
MPYTSWDMATISKIGPMIAKESAKAQGLKVKPASRVRAAQSNHSDGRSDTMGGQQLAHQEPHRGDLVSSSFVSKSRPKHFLHAPLCGMALSHPCFPARDYPGKTVETPGSEFDRGGISPCPVLWRGTCTGWLSPVNDDLGSTQILTWHYGA